jgi:multidrug efflux system membrane fusion protein
MRRIAPAWHAIFVLGLGVLGGCRPSQATVAPAQAPAIPVSSPVSQEVTDFMEFTGRTEAVHSVNIVPRVTGYLVSAPFREGAEVTAGDLLFEIDPKPYQAQYDQAASQVALYQAQVKEAQADYNRNKAVAQTAPGAVTQQDLDRYLAVLDESVAAVKAAQASLEIYKINLGYCKVVSPIDGMVSRYYLTVGNLVNQDQTQLTTVVSLDPMYVYFDLDETTLQRVRTAINEHRIERYQQGQLPFYVGLSGEDGFPHEGKINFVNNTVNAGTGSITVRGSIDNKRPEGGTRIMSPGMFVRVRLPIGKPHRALLVIDRALGFDQGVRYAFVVGKNNVIEQRRVTTGALQENGLRVIESGLTANDTVVVGGIQQVRPRMQIRPDLVTMPTLTAAAEEVPGSSSEGGGEKAAGGTKAPPTAPAEKSENDTTPIKTPAAAPTVPPKPSSSPAPATPAAPSGGQAAPPLLPPTSSSGAAK